MEKVYLSFFVFVFFSLFSPSFSPASIRGVFLFPSGKKKGKKEEGGRKEKKKIDRRTIAVF